MPTDSFVQVQPDSTGKKVDTFTLDNANVRQSVCIGGPSLNADILTPVNGGLPVSVIPGQVTATDKSGTITTGGTAQVAIAANSGRKGFLIHNPSTATEILQVKLGSGGGLVDLLAGGTWESGAMVWLGDIYVKAATTAHAWTAYEGT